jgi:aerobic C4-dicarboxylate transport protein
VAIAAWEGDIDRERAHAVLNGTHSPEDEPLAEPGTPESPVVIQPAH